MGLSKTGWSCLLATSVSGYKREPAPPARMMPFIGGKIGEGVGNGKIEQQRNKERVEIGKAGPHGGSGAEEWRMDGGVRGTIRLELRPGQSPPRRGEKK